MKKVLIALLFLAWAVKAQHLIEEDETATQQVVPVKSPPKRGASGPRAPTQGSGQQVFPSNEPGKNILNPTIQGNGGGGPGSAKSEQDSEGSSDFRPTLPPANQAPEPLPKDTYMFHLIPMTRIPTAGAASLNEAHLTHSSKIFTSVVTALEAYPGRRFTIGSNVALFERWFEEQTHAVKTRVQRLVASRALEFVDGGWVNADYSCPSWDQLLANIVAGHRFLFEVFGVRPRHAWAPSQLGFGQSEIFQKLGYESLFIGKVDKREREWRKENQELEMWWRGPETWEGPTGAVSSVAGKGIFTHIMHEEFNAPCEFGSSPFTLKKDAEKHFLKKLSAITSSIDDTLKCLQKYASHFRTRHLMITAGSDYAFNHAEAHFNFLERAMVLLHGKKISLENGKQMTFRFKYSSIDSYFTELQAEAIKQSVTFPTYQGDFLPFSDYTSDGEDYQATGHYSHRPLWKSLSRDFSSLVETSLTFYALDVMKAGGSLRGTDLHQRAPKESEVVRKVDMRSGKSIINELQEGAALLADQNLATGASTKVVLMSTEQQLHDLAKRNSAILSDSLKKQLFRETNLQVSNLYQCQYTPSITSRHSSRKYEKPFCPAQQTLSSWQHRDGFTFLIYNPSSTHPQQLVRLAVQMRNEQEGKDLFKTMTVHRWDSEHKAFLDVKEVTESLCYRRPTMAVVTVEKPREEMEPFECEIMIYQTVPPMGYEVFKVLYKDEVIIEDQDSSDESIDETDAVKPSRKRTQPITNDPKLRGFRGQTFDLGDDLDYFKLCRDLSLVIQNDEYKVRIKHCIQNRVQFGITRRALGPEEYDVDFDFRFYSPYHGGGLVGGGLYVFKTSDNDTMSYQHRLKQVKVYKGKQISMFVLTYLNRVGPLTQVKVKLGKNEFEALEFEVFFGALDRKKYQSGQEVTINWGAHQLNSRGLFYSDSNAYRLVKHDVHANRTYYIPNPQNKNVAVSSYFFPVNSGLFIEDQAKGLQMLVMNDRPQAASAYHCDSQVELPFGCRVEYLFMRRTQTSDNLGVHEGMDDFGPGGSPTNFSGRFWLSLTKNRSELYSIMQRQHLRVMNRPQIMFSRVIKPPTAVVTNKLHKEQELRQADFMSWLSKQNVLDVKLIPSSDMSLFNMRVHRSLLTVGDTSHENYRVKAKELFNQVCKYQYGQDCTSIVENLEITRLDGISLDFSFEQDQRFLKLDQSAESSGSLFTVDNYRIVLKGTASGTPNP